MKCSLVLPCRNEAKHLKKVVAIVPDCVGEIIIVDNCSADNTRQTCKKLAATDKRVRCVTDNREINGIGYGFAIMTGLASAKGEFIVIADGDGSYPLKEIGIVLDWMQKQGHEFVSCARYPLRKGAAPIELKLRLGVKALNIWTRILYRKKFHDILSGMMIIRRRCLDKLHLDAGDWNMSPQLKLESFSKLRASEFHISQQIRYGKTKQKYFITGSKHAWWILRNRLRKNP